MVRFSQNFRRLIGAMGLVCCLGGCQQPSPPSSASIRVSRVISGQSIEWIDTTQQPPVIQTGRLIGVSAPDLAQEPWGKQAQQRLEELVMRSSNNHEIRVEIDSDKPDRFGRKLIYLWRDRDLINEQLIKEGLVLVDTHTDESPATTAIATIRSRQQYRERALAASQYARLMGKGIWNPNLPMRTLPADFRREQR